MGLSENFIRKCLIGKAFSDSIRSGFLVPYEKSRFLITFSNSIRSGLILYNYIVFLGVANIQIVRWSSGTLLIYALVLIGRTERGL